MGRTSLRIILSDVGERRLGPRRLRRAIVRYGSDFSSISGSKCHLESPMSTGIAGLGPGISVWGRSGTGVSGPEPGPESDFGPENGFSSKSGNSERKHEKRPISWFFCPLVRT